MEYLFQIVSQQPAPAESCDDSSDDEYGCKGMDLVISEGDLLRIIRNKSTLGLCMVKHQNLLDYLSKESTLIEIMRLIFNRVVAPLNSSLCTDTTEELTITDSILNPQPASPMHVTSDDLNVEMASKNQKYPVTLDDVSRAIELIRTAERATTVLTHIISNPSILRVPFQAIAAVYDLFTDRVHALKNIIVNPASDSELENGCKVEITKAFDALLNICTLSVDNLPIFIDALEQPLFDISENEDSNSSSVLLIDVWVQLLLLNRAGSSFVRLVTNPKDKPAPLLDKLSGFLSQRKVFSTFIDHLFTSTNTSCDSITSILVQSLSSQAPWCNTIVQEFPRVFSLFLLLTGNTLPADLPDELLSKLPVSSPVSEVSMCLTSSIADLLVYMLRTIILDAITISLNHSDDTTLEGKTSITLEFLTDRGYLHANNWALFSMKLLPALCIAAVNKLKGSIDLSDGNSFPIAALLILKTIIKFVELTQNINDHIDSVLISKNYGCSSKTLLSVISFAAAENSSCGTLPPSLRLLGWDIDPSEFFSKLRYGDAGRLCDVSIEPVVKTIVQSGLYSILCKAMHAFPTATIVLFLCSRFFIVAAFYLSSSESELVKQALEQSGIFEELEHISVEDDPNSIIIRSISEMDGISIDDPLPEKFLPYRFRSPLMVHFLGVFRAFIRLAANITQNEYASEWSRYLDFRESPSTPPTHTMTYTQLKDLTETQNSLRALLLSHQKLATVSSAFFWLDRVGGNCYFKGLLPFSRKILSLGISTYVGVSLDSLKEYAEKEPVFAASQDWSVNGNFSLKQNIVLNTLKQMLALKRGVQLNFTETDLTSIYNGIMSTSLDDEEENEAQDDSNNPDAGQSDENVDVTSYLANNADESPDEQTGATIEPHTSESFGTSDVIAFAECLPEELEPPIELMALLESDNEILPRGSEACDISNKLLTNTQVTDKELEEKDDTLTNVESRDPVVCATAKELAHALHNSPPHDSLEVIPVSETNNQPCSSIKTPDSIIGKDQIPCGQYEQQINIIPLTSVDSINRSYGPSPIPKSSSPPVGIHNRASRGACSPNKPLVAVNSLPVKPVNSSLAASGTMLTEKSPRAKPATRPFMQSGRPVREAVKASNEYCNIPANEGRFMTFEEATAALGKPSRMIGRRARINNGGENEFKPLSKKMMGMVPSYGVGISKDCYRRT